MNLCTKVKRAYHRATHLWTVKIQFGKRVVTRYAKDAADAFELADCYGLEHDVTVYDFQKPYASRLSARDGAWVRS